MSNNLKFYFKRWKVKTKFSLNNEQIRQKTVNYYKRCIDCYRGDCETHNIASEKIGCNF